MMNQQVPGAGPQRVQSDAICAKCGSVNPEGVVQCMNCGNNLVEQHRQRIAQGGAPVLESSSFSFRGAITGAISLVGVLLIIFVVLNANQIENIMVQAQGNIGPARLWDGTQAVVFKDLSLQLGAAQLAEEEFLAALEGAQPIADLPGRYAIYTGAEEPVMAGVAVVRQEGEQVYFVGKTLQGAEIRGLFTIAPGTLPDRLTVMWENAGLEMNGNLYGCAGAALISEIGIIGCFGQTEMDTNNYEFSACKLP